MEERGAVPDVKDEVLYTFDSQDRRNSNRGYRYTNCRNGGRRSSRSDRGAAISGGRSLDRNRRTSTNPTDSHGNVMRGLECDSTKHFVADCPHRSQTQDVHTTLLNSNPSISQKNMLAEALGRGLLDSGCSKTVAGKVWVAAYLETLEPDERKKVQTGRSNSLSFW